MGRSYQADNTRNTKCITKMPAHCKTHTQYEYVTEKNA